MHDIVHVQYQVLPITVQNMTELARVSVRPACAQGMSKMSHGELLA